ncbi:MAG: hypothetical protein WC028_18545 [Candidatus Obscuribacterales bacterium]
MPISFKMEGLPAGFAVGDYGSGRTAKLVVSEFLSSEDGNQLIKRLEGMSTLLLDSLPEALRVSPSQIDSLLAIIQPDSTVTLYINELEVRALISTNVEIKPGDPVLRSSVTNIARIEFEGVQIPCDCGFFYLFSIDWRKGLFYDISPLQGEPRRYDLGPVLASMRCYLQYQHIFGASFEEWETLIENSWFPFISLSKATIEAMFWSARTGEHFDELAEKVAADFDPKLDERLKTWKQSPHALGHHEFLDLVVKHYKNKDFISASAVLYPRIEGLLRTFHIFQELQSNFSQDSLTEALVQPHESTHHDYSLLLPTQFRRFLKEVYFKSFDPRKPKGVSRHTVSHGVAVTGDMDKKASLLGLLTVDQLFYLMQFNQEPLSAALAPVKIPKETQKP